MHSSLDLPVRQRRPSNGQSRSLTNAVGMAGPWFTAVRGLVLRPRSRHRRRLLRCVDGTRGLAGRRGRYRGPGVRLASVPAGQGRGREGSAAPSRNVHGAQRLRLASHRARGQELRPHSRVRHPIRVRQSPDRRQVRERLRGPLRRRRAAEPACGDPVSGADAGVAHRMGFCVGPPRAGRSHRVAFPRCDHLLRPAQGGTERARAGRSSDPPRCWTGRRCTRSSGWSC